MTTRRASLTITAVVVLLVAAAALSFLTGASGPLAALCLLGAIVLAVGQRSNLARSLRPATTDHRHRLRVRSALWAALCVSSIVVGMIDLGGRDHWPMGRVLVYNVVFFGSAFMAIGSLLMSFRRVQVA